MKKVTVSLVSYNNLGDLKICLQSLFSQTFTDFQLVIVDNNSQDGTRGWLEKNHPDLKLISNDQNRGFSYAHNQVIKQSQSDFILILNPDVVLQPDFLQLMVQELDNNQKLGSLSAKVYRMESLPEETHPDIIDSTGIKPCLTRQFLDRGQGTKDLGQYDNQTDIFGPSGAAAFYRQTALDDVKIGDEYFDNDFFAFKEDLDLAWRLQHRGWQSKFVPKAIAHHRRTARYAKNNIIKNRQERSDFINLLSYRNHLYLITKNELSANFLRYFIFIFGYELKKAIFLLFLEPTSLKAWGQFLGNRAKMKNKRQHILSNSKADPKTLNKFFN
ncbi:glycosyltransferase family 2 protein [Patescibacteria group bacterium]|nr:glycosyltransferase family 2 protein [Patescibacteria group bacterium]